MTFINVIPRSIADDARDFAIGSLLDFAGAAAPTDWLIADGAALLKTAYPELFALLGTNFGDGLIDPHMDWGRPTWTAEDSRLGHSLRVVVPASAISVDGERCRLRIGAYQPVGTVGFSGPSSGLNNHANTYIELTSMYVGHQAVAGDPYDFDGTQVEVTFGGSSGAVVTHNKEMWSDLIAYSVDASKNLVISFDVVAAGARTSQYIARADSMTGWNTHYKSASAEASATDVTGYTTQANVLSLISGFIVAGYDGATFNLPDYRGRTFFGAGQGAGLPLYSLYEEGGEHEVRLSGFEMPDHSHGNAYSSGGGFGSHTSGSIPSLPGSGALVGEGDGHNNMSPYLSLNKIIRVL